MWKLLGEDETCCWPEEYNEYKTKKAALAAYKEELANWLSKSEDAWTETIHQFGKEGKRICFPDNYEYALWIEESDEPEDKFELYNLYKDSYGNYVASLYNPKRQYWTDKTFMYYTKKGVINELRHGYGVTVGREFC